MLDVLRGLLCFCLLQHGGKLPQNSAEKKQFKQSVRELARGSHEENMLEAYAQAHVAYAEYKVNPVQNNINKFFEHALSSFGAYTTTNRFQVMWRRF